jgi:predicted exporter
MLLFLHKIRCTLIPAIVAPVALLGTFTVMLLSGYSINILTMFGMVLACLNYLQYRQFYKRSRIERHGECHSLGKYTGQFCYS